MTRQLSIIEQRIVWTRIRPDTDKTVLRVLARWFAYRSDGTHVCPRDVPALAAKTRAEGISYRSTERALRRLQENRWLEAQRQHRQATTYRICVERLATEDPDQVKVVVDHDHDFVRQSGGQIDGLSAKVADRSGFVRQSGGQVADKTLENGPDFEKVADKKSVPLLRTKTCTSGSGTEEEDGTDSSTKSSATLAADVALILAWWTANYPLHNRGAQFTIHRGHRDAVQDVLRGRTLARVQAMILAMWQMAPDGNPKSPRSWIAGGDKSPYVLRSAANFLDRFVAGLEPEQLTFGPMAPAVETPVATRHEVTVDNVWTAILARVKDKVNRHSFDTWFQPTRLVGEDTTSVTIYVQNDDAQDRLLNHYAVILREAFAEVGQPELRVTFVTSQRAQKTG